MKMQLESKDRLTLALLYRVLEKVSGDSENYAAMYEALEGGYTYDYPTDGFISLREEHSEAECKEVWDILRMFDHIDGVLNRLSDTVGLELYKFKFAGFDGNHDWQYGYHRYIIETLGNYKNLTSVAINSHGTVLPLYRAKLAAWKKVTDKYEYDLKQITKDDLLEVQRA